MNGLPPVVSRALALALLAGVLLLAAVFGVMPMLERMRDADESLAFNRDIYVRLSQSVRDRATHGERIEALKARIDASGAYLRADTEPLAAAALQERLKQAVGRHGGELRSVQGLPSQPEEGMTRIGLRVVMTGSLGPIFQVLHELESGEPYLFVTDLQIKSARQRRRRAEEAEVELLSVRFDVEGYMPPEVAN